MSEAYTGNIDAVSRLLQMHANRADISLRWTGVGPTDIEMFCTDYQNKSLLSKCLWNGLKELMAMPELKELPEPLQAKICSIVLQANAVFELKIAARNQKKGAAPFVPGAT